MYNLRKITSFTTLKAFKFGPKLWKCVDCVEDGANTDPYVHQIGPWFETLGSLIEYAEIHYKDQYP